MATIVSRDLIEQEAREAAQAGESPRDACRWPFSTPEGEHWLAVFFLTRNEAQTEAA